VTTILAFLFVLGVLVFVHELGHFLAARRIGVRVLTFSLGFGPKILSTRRGDTEYAISASVPPEIVLSPRAQITFFGDTPVIAIINTTSALTATPKIP